MVIPRISRLSSVGRMTSHPDYRAAKSGSMDHARRLVEDILPKSDRFSHLRGFICPVIKESGNRIPLALAQWISRHSDLHVCESVTLKPLSHDCCMIDRLHYLPEFTGAVTPANYIIVDDVYTSGSTLMALKRHIESQGGKVTAAFTIGSSRSTEFEPSRLIRKILLARFPDIDRYYDLNYLTVPQIRYILRFSSLHTIFQLYGDHLLGRNLFA